MEEYIAVLEQAYADYRRDVEVFEQHRRPADGLLGFGRTLGNDSCNERLDKRVEAAVRGLCESQPTPEIAQQAVKLLITWSGSGDLPMAAQWMLRAIERHSLPLIPYLRADAAAELLKEYSARYKPRDLLPAQKEVYKALNERALSGR